mgnify:FL=1
MIGKEVFAKWNAPPILTWRKTYREAEADRKFSRCVEQRLNKFLRAPCLL